MRSLESHKVKSLAFEMLDEISAGKMERSLKDFSKISFGSKGVSRLAYSTLERESHQYFSDYMSKLGLTVWTDSVGNTLAQYPATQDESLPFLATGSHLDSVPEGGAYDGIVGVVASMEIARVLSESGATLKRPWRFIVFAAEEGARFGQACNGSRAIAGLTDMQELEKLLDSNGTSLAQAMRELNFEPARIKDAEWNAGDCFGFIELHIEQGNVLETESLSVGIVNIISGSQRLLVTVTGVSAHSGGTPMPLRKDALLTAAKAIVAVDSYAREARNAGIRITVGRITTLPGSITTVPGWVQFSVDIRDFEIDRQERVVEDLSCILIETGKTNGTDVSIEPIGCTSPIKLSSRIIEIIEQVSVVLDMKSTILPSGASHDCQQISRIADAGLIFVASKAGHSHMPDEFSSVKDIVLGTRLLFASLLELDCNTL